MAVSLYVKGCYLEIRTQWLLLQEKENGIDELQVLGQVVELWRKLASFTATRRESAQTHIVQNDQLIGPATLMVANGVENAIAHDFGDQLLQEQHQQNSANGRQVEVVDLEQAIELQRGIVLHDLATSEYENVVGDEHDGAGLECRQGCLALDEAEVLRLVALDRLEGLLENWPQLNAKRPVESWRTDLDPIWLRHCGGWCLQVAWMWRKRARRVEGGK